MPSEFRNLLKLITLLAVILFAVILGLNTIYTVDAGDRAVLTHTGKITGSADPGLHSKVPFMDSVHRISVRTQSLSYEGLQAYTFDQQIATADKITVTFRVPADRVVEVYSEFKTPESLVQQYVGRKLNARFEEVMGRYTAEKAVQDRQRLTHDLTVALQDIPASAPLEILSVELESISFPPEYDRRINERMNAEIEVSKKVQEVLQAEQDRLKAQKVADGAAYAQRATADATAYATTKQAEAQAAALRLKGEAEADAIRAKSKALADNPALIELTKAEQWNGVLPTTMVPSTAVPFIGVK